MKQKTLSDKARNNKTAMLTHGISVAIMTIFCVLQSASGLQAWGYSLLVAILGFVPVIADYIFWCKDKETNIIKHIVAIGFAIFYTYTLFTSFNNMVFAFVIPMILVISIYNDARYSLIINAGTVIESFLIVIIGAKTGKFGYNGFDSAIIQVVVMILVCIYSLITTKTLDENTKQKLQNITDAQNKTELVLNNLSELSQKMKDGIEDIYHDIAKLSQSTTVTKEAMQQVSTGSTDTAEAVQNQLIQTEAIQDKVNTVNDAATHITVNMQQTLTVLENGNHDVEILVQKVEASVQNGAEVAEKLKTLDKYISEMNSIVELISGITSQTGLLALNASIEAARAGEAGRGFSVVATEISKMASQTNDATVHITELITNVSSAINEVVDVIYQMISGINEEKQSTANTAESFNIIQTNTVSIRDNIDSLAKNIIELKNANHVIVDSIQTISAISEEVSAHANETMNSEEENSEILNGIERKMQALINLINN